MDAFFDFLGQGVGTLTIGDLALAMLALAAGWSAGRVARRVLSRLEAAVPEQTARHAVLGAITDPAVWLLRGLGVWAALTLLPALRIEGVDTNRWINSSWTEYMQIREEFLLRAMDEFKAIGLSFAFPTRTVHYAHAQPPGAPPAMLRQAPR